MERCELCTQTGGELLWQGRLCRVVLVGGAEGEAYPGFCRVIWREHKAEMGDLPLADSQHLMAVVMGVEYAVRDVVHPHKINLASLGNVVPHLHWHVIPRWKDDCNFPRPIWATAVRATPPNLTALREKVKQNLISALKAHLGDFE